jgi:hypothetical protein
VNAARRSACALVGWDAADWKVIHPLMDAGKMPNVQRLVETARWADRHAASAALADAVDFHRHRKAAVQAWHPRLFRADSGWPRRAAGHEPVAKIESAVEHSQSENLRSVVIGWWPSHPAEPINGVMVSDHYHRASGPLDKGWPLQSQCGSSAGTGRDAGRSAHASRPSDAGDGGAVYSAGREIDQDLDKRLAGCMRTLAECMSVQAAAMWLLENQPWDFFAVYYDAIDHFCHGFMKYHPPRQSWIGERDFELYQNVVSMAYQFHDQMLGSC